MRFQLPDSLRSTDVQLLLTVKINDITESIARSVPVVLNKIDLQFLPEGGALVAGFASNIAFRAVDEFGKPAQVKGIIIDQHGKGAAAFDTYRYGMGQFTLTPEPGKSYYAKLTGRQGNDTIYLLPTPTATGMVMRCFQEGRMVRVMLEGNDDREFNVTIHLRERQLQSHKVRMKVGRSEIRIPTDSFPAGILRIRLQTLAGIPVAERRVFVRSERRMRVSLKTDKEKYLPRR